MKDDKCNKLFRIFWTNFLTFIIFKGLAAIVSAQNDPSQGGLFSTPKPYVDPDEYVQPENKQDQFDWKLTKVSDHFFADSWLLCCKHMLIIV